MDQWRERVGRSVEQASDRARLSALQDEDSPARVRAMEEQARTGLPGWLVSSRAWPGVCPRRTAAVGEQFGEWGKGALDYYAASPADWPEPQQSALGRVEEVLGQLSELDDVEPGTTLAGFRQALEQALDAPSGRTGATGSGVFVASLGAAIGMEFDAVWILGMAEGVFPPRAAEDQLLPEDARRSLGNGKLRVRRDAVLDERRRYLAAVAAAASADTCLTPGRTRGPDGDSARLPGYWMRLRLRAGMGTAARDCALLRKS